MGDQALVHQAVSADGEFDAGFDGFVRRNGLHEAGADYQIVAITGPQSSGKSTLMNKLFGTRFEEMDAISGRSQTTRGIWLARSPKIARPATLILDLEGSDGRERGEDDNSFERQSSLFALAVADVLIINMWAKDVGREAGAGKPLLKTIFQVNLKLFAPDPHKERTVLLFVFRDRTRTPLPLLVQTWEEDLGQIWASLAKPPQYEGSSFSDFFEVKYETLPNYEDKEEEFLAETVLLRRRFTEDGEDSLLRPAAGKLPGQVLAMNLKSIWETIRSQKDLNLPAHKVVVANYRCGEIARERLEAFEQSSEWAELSQRAAAELVPGFGEAAAQLLRASLAAYDEEASLFEAGVRQAKREALESSLLAALQRAFAAQLGLLSARCLAAAKAALGEAEAQPQRFHSLAAEARSKALSEFDAWLPRLRVEGADWDAAPARRQLAEAVDGHTQRVVASKVAEAVGAAEQRLGKAVSGPLIAMLDACPPDLWPRANRLLAAAVPREAEALVAALAGFQLGEARHAQLRQGLQAAATAKAAAHVREAANTALARMRDRFQQSFTRDEQALPRRWGPRDNIPAVMHRAFAAAAAALAQLAVLRLGPGQEECAVVDAGVRQLTAAELGPEAAAAAASGTGAAAAADFDVQAAAEWPGVPPERVLLSPPQCRQLWRQCVSDSQLVVQQAQATQEANRAASNQMPPLWALAAMALLGFNEFLALLYNPLWLLLCIALFLFGKTVYSELDIDGEMQAGLLPGLLAVAHKFVPTVQQARASLLVVWRRGADALLRRLDGAGRGLGRGAAGGGCGGSSQQLKLAARLPPIEGLLASGAAAAVAALRAVAQSLCEGLLQVGQRTLESAVRLAQQQGQAGSSGGPVRPGSSSARSSPTREVELSTATSNGDGPEHEGLRRRAPLGRPEASD